MRKKSAGLLLFRKQNNKLQVLLVHPGGPFWAKKDLGAWSVPKGELNDGEDILAGAKREFFEEMGVPVDGEFIEMKPVMSRDKVIHVFAIHHEFDSSTIRSNLFSIEWPPGSGRIQSFPEVDRGEWFDLSTGLQKINQHQAAILRELREKIGDD